MARNDIRIQSTAGANVLPTYSWKIASGTPITVKAGEPTKAGGTSSNSAVLLADADLVIGTGQTFLGVAAKDSTETASVAGAVDLYMPLPGVVYEVAAKTATNANTAALILAMSGQYQIIDLTTSTFTMDTAAGDGAASAFLIVGGNPITSTVYFMVRSDATVFGRARV